MSSFRTAISSILNITAFNTVGVNGLLSRSIKSGSAWNQTYYAFDWRGNTVNRIDGATGNLLSSATYKAYNSRNADVSDGTPYEGFGGAGQLLFRPGSLREEAPQSR